MGLANLTRACLSPRGVAGNFYRGRSKTYTVFSTTQADNEKSGEEVGTHYFRTFSSDLQKNLNSQSDCGWGTGPDPWSPRLARYASGLWQILKLKVGDDLPLSSPFCPVPALPSIPVLPCREAVCLNPAKRSGKRCNCKPPSRGGGLVTARALPNVFAHFESKK